MFHVLNITYTQPLDVVDQARPAHLEWLDAEIAAGNILISGRNEAGTGGVLITGDIAAEDAEALIAAGHVLEWFEVEPDLIGLTAKPGVGIGQQTLLVRTDEGNLLWDPPGLITDEAVDHVRRQGRVVAIAARTAGRVRTLSSARTCGRLPTSPRQLR